MARPIKACVIGAGPNGLAAAIVLAQAGIRVDVFEAELIPGGAARTMELTLPGFHHDFGSAVHPLAAGSPFFTSVPLHQYGLEWIHSPVPLAHPLDDGSAAVLERELDDSVARLGPDGKAWSQLVRPFVENWPTFAQQILGPPLTIPKHPALIARFGIHALTSAAGIVNRFRTEKARALFAGLAAHSFLRLDQMLSGAVGLMFGVSAHAVGWPIPRGGAQSLTNALCRYLSTLGGTVKTSSRIESVESLGDYDLILLDLTPRQIRAIAGRNFSDKYNRSLDRYRYGPGAFKVDYALNAPIPWRAAECRSAATVHIGGTFEEIAASEKTVCDGQHAEHPFVLLAQPSLFDMSRAPVGKHTAWAYCHVPNGFEESMLQLLENQIERFAPGFRETILARRVFNPSDLEQMDANLIGGDISGGAMNLSQLLFRPTRKLYKTSSKRIYICSSSTPPGAGVHGMCGYHAAHEALAQLH